MWRTPSMDACDAVDACDTVDACDAVDAKGQGRERLWLKERKKIHGVYREWVVKKGNKIFIFILLILQLVESSQNPSETLDEILRVVAATRALEAAGVVDTSRVLAAARVVVETEVGPSEIQEYFLYLVLFTSVSK